ncbi:7-carboxy-7-deazaguanine synthase QueE [Pontiella sp.]|uniref:7-carboxy-7-deazaguanine synthase QueE n=1 Tax=Pontiella sp. TaxID=2837462 RepID=UPI00356515FF
MKTYLSEIFSSIQGEGPYVGERHLFVRFCACHRKCVYCDTNTELTDYCIVERRPGSGEFEQVKNAMSEQQVFDLIQEVNAKTRNNRISITGGAPLMQHRFLLKLLPMLKNEGHNIYLETAGDLPSQLMSIIEFIDVIAMDVKLESVTEEPATFPAHWQFLKICRDYEVETFVKLVLSANTHEGELMEAAKGIKKAGGEDTLVIIQPMTKASRTDAVPSGEQLFRWQDKVASVLPNVRVIPQTHKMLEML